MNKPWTIVIRTPTGERTSEQVIGNVCAKKMASDYTVNNPDKKIEAMVAGTHEFHIINNK